MLHESHFHVQSGSLTRYQAQYTDLGKNSTHQRVKEYSQPGLRSIMHRVENLSCDFHSSKFQCIVGDAFQCDSSAPWTLSYCRFLPSLGNRCMKVVIVLPSLVAVRWWSWTVLSSSGVLHENLVLFLQRCHCRTVELHGRISCEGTVGVRKLKSLGRAMLRDTDQQILRSPHHHFHFNDCLWKGTVWRYAWGCEPSCKDHCLSIGYRLPDELTGHGHCDL